MNRLMRSLSSEWRKVRATKLWWILAIVLAGYSAAMAAFFAFMFASMNSVMQSSMPGTMPGMAPVFAIPSQTIAEAAYTTVTSFGYVIPLLLGALMATGELRHRTLALTFTLEPRRGTVLLSKIIVLLGYGTLLGIAGIAGSVGSGAAVIAANDGDPMLGSSDTWALIFRALVAIALWAVIGFGVGMLVKNQAFAIVLALVFTQFLEPVLRSAAQIWDWTEQVGKFLPGAATDAFVGANVLSAFDSAAAGPASGQLEIWAGILVLLGYAAVTVVGGWALRWRRDAV